MESNIQDTICQAVVTQCIEEYLKYQKIPSVSSELNKFLDRNSLAILAPDVFAELVYQTSHILQNFILERRTDTSLRIESNTRIETPLRQEHPLLPNTTL